MDNKKLEKLKEREALIKEQIKQEKAKLKAQERKARNHRLIEVGATIESALGIEFTKSVDIKHLYEALTEKRVGGSGYEYTVSSMIVNAILKKEDNDKSIQE
jgi:hypothetical protein